MITVTAVWFLVGLIVIIGMLIFAILKQMKWKTFGIATSIYIVVLFFMFVIAGSQPVSTSTSSSSNRATKKTIQKSFKVVSKADDDGDYQTDANGNFELKIKALKPLSVKVTCEDNEVKSFKPKTIKLKAGQVTTIPIALANDEMVPTFVLKSSNGYKKEIDVYNNSDAVNSSMSAKESSEAANEPSSDDEDSDGSKSSSKKYSNGKDVAKALNDAAANDPRLNGLHVTYKDSIFYVNIPTEITQTDDNTQKSVYRNVARTLHGYQKSPTGVIYFEDEEGNIVATTKVLNNNDVKLE
ncbi:hypothetical protein DT304_00205 [Lactobacillus reuteri]|uniref:hypothetical protein n=2 Tax=Limosilactobacillus reuteri TaxID=1598 RepID=UPI001651E4DF|nr:hypothetical protein [Limosilactobacillus reuteri]MBC6909759.1 hypothetical protein [Limosilactobacillus reuteri]